jgi:hypothetical protein
LRRRLFSSILIAAARVRPRPEPAVAFRSLTVRGCGLISSEPETRCMFLSVTRLFVSVRSIGLMLIVAFAASSAPQAAQRIPSDDVIEITIKRHLASFNDANITGNYEVWHETLSRPFRQQFSPERLKTVFKAFHDQQIDISPVLSQAPVLSEPARIDREGVLLLKGAFETRPSRVIFDMRLLLADGDWKLVSIHVNVLPVTDPSSGDSSGKRQGAGKR